MPYINLQITKGASREQKAQLVKESPIPWCGYWAKSPNRPIS